MSFKKIYSKINSTEINSYYSLNAVNDILLSSNFASKNPLTLPNTFADTQGIINYLGTKNETITYINPHTLNNFDLFSVIVTASSNFDHTNIPESLLSRQANNWASQPLINSWWQINFLNKQVVLFGYLITNRAATIFDSPRHWRIEGSNDGITWTTLDTKSNINWNVAGQSQYFTLSNTPSAYQYLRFFQTGLNIDNRNFLCLGNIEFYGLVFFTNTINNF